MRLQTRFILFLAVILLAVGLTVWYGVRPGYEDAVLDERVTIMAEQQRERIELAEHALKIWIGALLEVQKNLIEFGDVNQTRLLFSGFSSLAPEIIGLRLIEQTTGEFVEFRAAGSDVMPDGQALNPRPLGTFRNRFDPSETQNMFLSWSGTSGYAALISVFTLGNDTYRLVAYFDSGEIEYLLLSHTLGIPAQAVLWFDGSGDGFSRSGQLPGMQPPIEPVTRYREADVDGRASIVLSSPVPSLNAQHVIYAEKSSIYGPVRRLFSHSLLVLFMAFFALSLGSVAMFHQLTLPIRRFIEDIQPFKAYDFTRPVRTAAIPELRDISVKLEEIRGQLAYYQRINVEKVIMNQESLSLMMEYSSDPIAVFDAESQFTFRNTRFVDLFLHGGEPAPGSVPEFQRSALYEEVKVDDPAEYRVRPLVVRNEGREIRFVDEDEDKAYFYNQQSISVYNEEGDLLGGLLLLYDLTRERELDQLRNDMINIIVHELKNPIAGIQGLTSALLDDPDFEEEELHEIYRLIDQSSQSLQELVERFLQVSRLQSNLAHIDKSPIYMPEIVRQVAAEMKILLSEKALKFRVDIDENIENVSGSYELMLDVVRNLLSNAIKYGGRDRTIDVSLKLDTFGYGQADVVFSVTDYGYGIAEEHREKIFKKFYRIKEYDLEKGTGLGLPHVREIIRLHDGTITVDSNPDIGSRFTVRLPYKPLTDANA